ncbi:unnamed protein product [Leuciscus chuanchicus]
MNSESFPGTQHHRQEGEGETEGGGRQTDSDFGGAPVPIFWGSLVVVVPKAGACMKRREQLLRKGEPCVRSSPCSPPVYYALAFVWTFSDGTEQRRPSERMKDNVLHSKLATENNTGLVWPATLRNQDHAISVAGMVRRRGSRIPDGDLFNVDARRCSSASAIVPGNDLMQTTTKHLPTPFSAYHNQDV